MKNLQNWWVDYGMSTVYLQVTTRTDIIKYQINHGLQMFVSKREYAHCQLTFKKL